jgi:hypothetical protein
MKIDKQYKLITNKQIPPIQKILRNTSYVPTNPHGQYKKNPPKYTHDNLSNHPKKIFDMYRVNKLNTQMKHKLQSGNSSKETAIQIWSLYKGIIRSIFNRIYELFISLNSYYRTHESVMRTISLPPNPRNMTRGFITKFNRSIQNFHTHLYEINRLCTFISINTPYYKRHLLKSIKNGMSLSTQKVRITHQRKILKYVSSYFSDIEDLSKYISRRIVLIDKLLSRYERDRWNLSKFLTFKQRSYKIMNPLLNKINVQRSGYKNYNRIFSNSNQKLII